MQAQVQLTLSQIIQSLLLFLDLLRYDQDAGKSEEAFLNLHEEYVKPPPPDYLPPSGQKCALGPLPEDYAQPTSRFVLRDMHIVIALCQAVSPGQGILPSPTLSLDQSLQNLRLRNGIKTALVARKVALSGRARNEIYPTSTALCIGEHRRSSCKEL